MPKRIPAEIKLLKGDDKAHPNRWKRQNRDAELKSSRASGPLDPTPPAWMSAAQARTYAEVIGRTHKGTICHADGPVIEMVTALLHEFRSNRGQLDDKTMGKLFTGLDKLGMTPASRGKVAMLAENKEDEDDPLNEFGT